MSAVLTTSPVGPLLKISSLLVITCPEERVSPSTTSPPEGIVEIATGFPPIVVETGPGPAGGGPCMVVGLVIGDGDCRELVGVIWATGDCGGRGTEVEEGLLELDVVSGLAITVCVSVTSWLTVIFWVGGSVIMTVKVFVAEHLVIVTIDGGAEIGVVALIAILGGSLMVTIVVTVEFMNVVSTGVPTSVWVAVVKHNMNSVIVSACPVEGISDWLPGFMDVVEFAKPLGPWLAAAEFKVKLVTFLEGNTSTRISGKWLAHLCNPLIHYMVITAEETRLLQIASVSFSYLITYTIKRNYRNTDISLKSQRSDIWKYSHLFVPWIWKGLVFEGHIICSGWGPFWASTNPLVSNPPWFLFTWAHYRVWGWSSLFWKNSILRSWGEVHAHQPTMNEVLGV
jgi:hypothetical protein